MTFTVEGTIRAKQRARVTRNGTYTPKVTATAEADIGALYKAAGGRLLDGAVRLSVLALFQVPKRTTGLSARPMKAPDADTILKLVADALNGVAYRDDVQVVDARCRKHWVTGPWGDLAGGTGERLVITVEAL